MSTIISVENLGKKYLLRHQTGQQPYVALRDVLSDGMKNLGRKLLGRSNQTYYGTEQEEFWALRDVSFEVKQGDRIGIIGRNGAGKSTLLKILSRITEPTTGRVRIKGRVASLLEVGTGFHPELTGRENIYLNGAILGMGRAEIKKKFDEIVDFAEIEKFLDTPVKRYSSGMYVRLAFAVAAHLEPEILVVDEVLAVGDVQFQKKCLGKMEDVSTKQGRTVLFVSHNMAAIRSLCDTSLLIVNGILKNIAPSDFIIQQYLNSTNLFIKENFKSNKRNYEFVKSNHFFISAATIMKKDGYMCNEFRYGDSLSLKIDFNGNISSRFSLEFYIYNDQGILVFVGGSGPHHGLYFDPVVSSVRIDIGPLALTSGKYSIKLSVVEGHDRLDVWDDAQCFSIVECLPFETSWDIPSHREGVCVIENRFHIL